MKALLSAFGHGFVGIRRLGLTHAILAVRDFLRDDDLVMCLDDSNPMVGGITSMVEEFRAALPVGQITVTDDACRHTGTGNHGPDCRLAKGPAPSGNFALPASQGPGELLIRRDELRRDDRIRCEGNRGKHHRGRGSRTGMHGG
jgi:hypothetical protein